MHFGTSADVGTATIWPIGFRLRLRLTGSIESKLDQKHRACPANPKRAGALVTQFNDSMISTPH